MKVGQASTTAKVIAASTLLLASRPSDQHWVPPGAAMLCRLFLSTTWADRLLSASATSPLTQWFWRALERMTHPGIMRHYLARKRWIEEQCQMALQEGAQRVIVIGAGLDTLALRLASHWPGVAWVEIDHPATQAFKMQALAQAGHHVPVNLGMQSVDLTMSPLPADLMHDTRPTLVVIEGVLMYLDEANIAALLRDQIRALSTTTTLIFSHMVRWPDGTAGFRPSSRLVDRWLSWRSEPFKWAITPAALGPWLQSQGFELLNQAEPPFLKSLAAQRGWLKGENLVKCRCDSK